MGRSNMFANIENKFEFATKEEIKLLTISAVAELVEALSEFENTAKFGVLITGAKLGVAGDGVINKDEKELIAMVFDPIWNGSIKEIYDFIGTSISEEDYNMVSMLAQINGVGLPLLHYILGFAYIDGKFEDKVAERLDPIFGMTLLAAFMSSGMEEVPAPRVRVSAENSRGSYSSNNAAGAQAQRPVSPRQFENECLKDNIEAEMIPGMLYSVPEIAQQFDCIPSGTSNQRISALMSQLVSEGRAERTVQSGTAYFTRT